METYIIHFTNVPHIIEEFSKLFKANPLNRVDLELEAIPLFNKRFPKNDADEHEMTEDQLKAFMHELHAMSVDRLLLEMDKKGLIKMGWDSKTNDFCWMKA